MLTRVTALCAASGLLALAGCTLYRPQLPATPLVGRGQVEASLGIRNFSNLEGGAAWSPLPHMLLSAEAALTDGEGQETVNNVTTDYHEYHRQVGVGMGGYWASATRPGWYVAALGGVGVARTQVYAVDGGFSPLPTGLAWATTSWPATGAATCRLT